MRAPLNLNPKDSELNDAIGRVNSIKVLYEKMLFSNDYQHTSLKDYLDNLIDENIDIFPEEINITVEKQIDDFQLNQERLVLIGIIVNELLTNIIKYAFIDRDSGLIEIILKGNQGKVSLTIQDNGIFDSKNSSYITFGRVLT